MSGDSWQRFANLRLYYTFMFPYPGKKRLFMGSEFGQEGEWNYMASLDRHPTENPLHGGVRAKVPREGYTVGVPEPGRYAEIMNSDAAVYGGTNVGNAGGVDAQAGPWNGLPHAVRLNVPPLSAVVLLRHDG